jgi:hypothetical protein
VAALPGTYIVHGEPAAALLAQPAQPLFSRKISGKLVIITKISRLINHLLPQSRMWLQKYHPSGRLA